MAVSKGEEEFAMLARICKIDEGMEREYRFLPPRRWRFDFAWPRYMVAVEIEGLGRGGLGRHQRVDGFRKDLEKYNHAAFNGWLVLRFTRDQLCETCALSVRDLIESQKLHYPGIQNRTA